MLIPSLNNSKIYDEFTKDEIVGLKISPCENFIAIITKNAIQIVSNRHNRVLLGRSSTIQNEDKIEKIGLFNGSIEWSNDSRTLILGSSNQQHVFVYNLNLTSPFEFFEGYNKESISNGNSSSENTDIEDNTDYEENFERNIDNVNYANSKSCTQKCNKKFIFITEELENGLINFPSSNISDEVFENLQEDLLSFQLINEYGTLREKEEFNKLDLIEFSTSHIELKFSEVINLYHKFDSFLLLYDEFRKENILLFSLTDYPILILICMNDINIKRNIFLNEYITIFNEKNNDFNKFNDFYLTDNLFDVFTKDYLSLLPIYNIELLEKNCISSYLNKKNDLKEIKLDNLNRNETSLYIDGILQKKKMKFPHFLDDFSNLKLYKGLVESFIQNEELITKDLQSRTDYKGFGICNLQYNDKFDWISLLLKPWNLLILFSWKNSFSKSFSLDENEKELDFSTCMGLVIQKYGILNYKLLNNNGRIIMITNESSNKNFLDIFNKRNGLEYEVCTDDFEDFQYLHDNEVNSKILKKKNDFILEIFSFNEYTCKDNKSLISKNIKKGKIKLNCIFNIKLSKLITSISLNAEVPSLSVTNSNNFILITAGKQEILILDSTTGKLTCKLSIEDFNSEKILKPEFKNFSSKSDFNVNNLNENGIKVITSAILISNDLSLLCQIKDKTNFNKLIEIPVYRLITQKSAISHLKKNKDDKLSCENLVFLGIENIGIVHYNNRNLNLDSNNFSDESIESSNSLNFINKDNFNTKNSNNTITSCFIHSSKLRIECIPIPPSIYINHNWPIKQAFLNKTSTYLLLSGYRGCAIYDLLNTRWRLFCDVSHELLLSKPNLPFGWITEWIFFLAVDSSLLLTTFYDIITSEEELWEISAFEKNKLYEKYINNLREHIQVNEADGENNKIDICLVFFDVRNSLDIRNIVGIIPFCSAIPLLIVNNNKNSSDSLIVYTSDFILTSYHDNKQHQSSIPSDIKWMIDLSQEWTIHPIEMLLLKEDLEKTTILTLQSDKKLYIITVFHLEIEYILNKKCEFKIESILNNINLGKDNCLMNYDNDIIKFGFVSFLNDKDEFDHDFTNQEFNMDEKLNPINFDIGNNQIKDFINKNDLDINSVFDNINELISCEFEIHDLNIKNIIFNKDVFDFVKNSIESQNYFMQDKPSLYWEENFDCDLFGIIWYVNELQEIYVIPISCDHIKVNYNQDKLQKIVNPPILVYSNQLNTYLIHVINFLPQLSSLFIFQSNKKLIIDSKKKNNFMKKNELNIEFTLNQILSPIIQELLLIPNKNKPFKLIHKLIKPLLNYIKIYPFEQILKMLINIFENMVFFFLKNSCKDYKVVLKQIIEKILLFSLENKLINNEKYNIDCINSYLNELFLILASNIKINNQSNQNDILKLALTKVLTNSWNINQFIDILNFIIKSLEINFDHNNSGIQNIKIKIFTYLIISITRKIDPLIVPCIIFPIINLNPIELFLLSLKTQNFNNAALYLIIIQSSIGPYFVRFEYSLMLLHNILSNVNITNYNQLLLLSNNIIKFILMIIKPSNINIKIPLSQQNESFMIIGPNNKNLQLNCVLFVNKIDNILEYHFISRVIQIEWINLIIICKYLNMNFNSWFKYCIQKYQPLWFEDNIDSTNYHLSSSFNDLILSIQNKFHLFNIERNTICLFTESFNKIHVDVQEFDEEFSSSNNTPKNSNKYNVFDLYNHYNSNDILRKQNYFSQFFFNQVIKVFFKAFLSNSMPIPALAIAYACNDMYSVHKILHDFPNLK